MIKNCVLTVILRLRAKIMCAHLVWNAQNGLKHMLINSIGHFDHFEISTRQLRARAKPLKLIILI